MALRWIVYTVGNRDISELQKNIPELEIVYDRLHDIMDTYTLVLKSVGDDPVVIMEDDIGLCEDFQRHVLDEITLHPKNVINFYTGKRPYTQSGFSSGDFMATCCHYFPPTYARELLRFFFLWNKRYAYITGTDSCINAFLRYYKLKYYYVVPNLIQHLGLVSEVNPTRSTKRQSNSFYE